MGISFITIVTNSRCGFTLALFKVCLGELNEPIYSEVRTDQRRIMNENSKSHLSNNNNVFNEVFFTVMISV